MSKVYLNNTIYGKVKEAEDKIKIKSYEMKDKIHVAISKAKNKIHHQSKLNRVGNYVSIAIALMMINAAWLTEIEWLLWLGLVSVLSNALLLILTPVKKY